MTSLADRLRGVIKPVVQDGPAVHAGHPDAAEVLGGEWRQARGQRCLVIDRTCPPGYRHGRVALGDCVPPDGGVWPRLPLLTAGSGPPAGRLLFLDLETTGLAGGAGTYAFLVGCGWFDGAQFRLRQLFLSHFESERLLLEELAELTEATACVVTYNGKAFDLPLIETRYNLQRMRTPFADLPHVDMLHPARRLWREEDVECRLTNLERTLCGHEREGDVPGFEIPSRYFQYVRTGDAHPLEGVLEHNRRDIVSLAMLTARAAQLLDDGPRAATTPREALGMARLYERAGMTEEALTAFSRAYEGDGAALDTQRQPGAGLGVRAEALRGYAALCRRLRRYEAAADAWRRLLDVRQCPPVLVREATEALAVHHEHRVRDLLTARAFAMQALQLQATPLRHQSVQYRLARLDRKLRAQPLDSDSPAHPLFPLTL